MVRAALLALLLLTISPHLAGAQTTGPGTVGVVSLKDALEKGLRARTPAEFEFVATVVAKVNAGELPIKLVDTTFQWARRKEHPFQSFQFALRSRAKKLNVTL